MTAWTAIVLAAGRGPDDPLASAFGVTHKCLIPLGGKPMLRRVVDTLAAHPAVAAVAVSIDDTAVIGQALGAGASRVTPLATSDSAPASVLAALDRLDRYPILVTTADHALLDRAMLDHFFSQSLSPTGDSGRVRGSLRTADLTVGLATAETILAAYPEARRTYLTFGRDRVSGCNLYGLMTPKARAAVELWRSLDQDRKRPWRIVRAFGVTALLRYALGRLSLDDAMAFASRRFDLTARAVLMPFAEAAIDVDKPADKELAESILRRAG